MLLLIIITYEGIMATSHTVINNFTSKGFKLLGHGCYAAVFDSKYDPNLVYKVGITTSDPFLAYIRQKSLVSNPHFPIIYDIIEADSWYLVKMEKLEPLPYHKIELSNQIRSLVDDDVNMLTSFSPTSDLLNITDKIRELADILDVKVDLHQGNIMMRGLVPVITDPLCDHDIYSEWALENWFGQKNKEQRCSASYSY